MATDNILTLKDLKWEVDGRYIINISSFELKKGEVVSVIGSNGSGKSSLLKIMALLEHPSEGEITFDGQRVNGDFLSFRRRLAFVFQEPLLVSGSIYDNIAQGLKYRGLLKKEIDRRVRFWAERFKISHLIERGHRNLSGGEAQRVNLARAFAVEPEILFLDEPFTALDLPTRMDIIEDIQEIIREKGISAVFVTHNPEELSVFAQRICVMHDGQIIQEGSSDTIFNRPINEKAAELAGVENILDGLTVNEDTIQINDKILKTGLLDIPKNTSVKVFIRPENILLGDKGNNISQNNFYGKIIKTVTLSNQYKLLVDCGFIIYVYIGKGLLEFEEIKPGVDICIRIPPSKIHCVIV